MAEALLEFSDVRAGYGEAVVLDGVSFALPANGSLALLGRNGAGKTTLLLAAMGFVTPSRGTIRFKGADITKVAPHKRAHMGLGWVPQEREVFPSLTVEENLIVTARPGRWSLDTVYGLLPRLKERKGHKGNHLSGGEQQMLTLGRTLMTNPSVLLLDEPLEGLAPIIVEELMAAIRRMMDEEGTTLVLVEQHAGAALDLTKDAILLERGVVVHHAPSAELRQDEATLERYLGLKLD
jgi:branched-chain amino acid transport system ATP-binding protein